ncbi:MAG: RagB/SusD family nutrient uptake outer membrane protein [Dysgonamonadaceae bacterium]|jgi:hypothetical protein|nr:RagB/SusD family nutrient uptake outer membrane protein [Dysgonamonadaceae bacterium]
MKITKIFSILAASLFMLTACDLEEETFTFVAGEDVAAAGAYDQLVAGAFETLSFLFEWGGYHDITNFDTDYQSGPTWAFGTAGEGNFYNNGAVNNLFNYYSTAIHRANYHYYLVSGISNISEKDRNNAMGELRVLKAWCLFQLVQFFGPIPLFKTSISDGNTPEQPRASVKEVYEHIIESLLEAEALMYPRTDASFLKGHVCRGTAKALLAKVYATIGSASMKTGKITVKGGPGQKENPDGTTTRLMPVPNTFDKTVVAGYEEFDSQEYYRLAMEKALEVIREGEFQLAASQSQLWSVAYKNGPEFQFCEQTANDAGNTLYCNFVPSDYLGWPNPTKNGVWDAGYYTQRDHWLQTFDDWADERITWGILHRRPYYWDETNSRLLYLYYPERDSMYVRTGQNGYDPSDQPAYSIYYGSSLMKFSAVTTYPLDGNRADYNWPYMRYAETLLLYAEADNEVNGRPSSEALRVVDELNARNNSTRASVRNSNTPFTQESFRSYILEERAKEFAGEGHRRYDLLRWGIYLQVMNAIGTVDENGVTKRREQKHLLLPLPPNEVNANPYIETNNPGW